MGHEVAIVDNLSRRWIDAELGVQSLTPMDSIQERLRVWKEVSGGALAFEHIDVASEYERFKAWLADWRPQAVVHFAEQRAAPYSMKSDRHKTYTVKNNVNATHNLLNALVATDTDAHVVHLGTMGVYGYATAGASIPEGYLTVEVALDDGGKVAREILHPTDAGSVYHMTKCLRGAAVDADRPADHRRRRGRHERRGLRLHPRRGGPRVAPAERVARAGVEALQERALKRCKSGR